jgi:Competence protein J (ComJ)
MEAFNLSVSYSQIAIFDGRMNNPFNDWTDTHVQQGFSWRPESVSFKTLAEYGTFKVEVVAIPAFKARFDTIRAISVPFLVKEGSLIEVASIGSSKVIKILSGTYELFFETGLDSEINWCRISFCRKATLPTDAKIIIQDEELSPNYPLLM